MHNMNERSVTFNEEIVGGRERAGTDEERVLEYLIPVCFRLLYVSIEMVGHFSISPS